MMASAGDDVESEIETGPAHRDEDYVAPDTQRLGTAEALTGGSGPFFVTDLASGL